MDRQALLTCNTRLVFGLDKDDLNIVSGTMGDLAEQVVARIPKLAKGTAIVSSGIDIMRHPALVRIRKRRTREGAPTPNLAEEVKLWRQQNN
jgi:DNA helicase HerA-like ATPase